jgi:hypothetical protein
VPAANTILKIAGALGPDIIQQLHRQVVEVAKRAGVTPDAYGRDSIAASATPGRFRQAGSPLTSADGTGRCCAARSHPARSRIVRGFPPEGIAPHLLIYEPGQFYAPHQDPEKSDDMIATLVILLPSDFTGGEIVLSHHDRTITFRGSRPDLTFIAFYADWP